MIQLDGKKAFVTGGSRGIGRATAILFARAGADVAINYRARSEAAEQVRKEVKNLDRDCLIVQADLSRKEDIDQMVDEIICRWKAIDILVNNAGIWTFCEIGTMNEDVWNETIRINLDGVFRTTNLFVPLMKEHKKGWIINVSSTAGIRGEAYHSHYAASKGAIISFTKSLAVELAPFNIRVNCVAPGWVDTEMCAEVFKDPKFRQEVENSIPLRRIPPPEDIAGPILFLASDLARHISGEVLNINGGSVLCT